MISPAEIKLQALKWWKPFLQNHIRDEPFFPMEIERIGKIQPADITQRFEALQSEIETLYRHSKNQTGAGYLIKTSGKNFRRTGTHELPDSVLFENAADYIHCIGKKKEWKLFLANSALLIGSLPELKEWAVENSVKLTFPDVHWENIVRVCRYFLFTPRPNLYLRQLPIPIPTKFIEENAPLLQSLLDFLIPEHIRDRDQKRFSERYFLKYDEPVIRIRILDEKLALPGPILDIGIRLSDFEKNAWPCTHVLIAENKMNFLTLPLLDSSIALWSGGGFNISYLQNIDWLRAKKILYWGDIDVHGFQILHQLRSYYPQTQSVLMDAHTFGTFREYVVNGEVSTVLTLELLNEAEAGLYSFLKSSAGKNRLEQEKIPQPYADAELGKALAV